MKKLLRANGAALSDSRSPNGSARSHRWIVLIVLALAVATTSGSVQAISALPTANAVTATASSGSTMTLTRPATVAAGDVLIASVEAAVSANVQIAAPSGWVLIRRDSNAPGYSPCPRPLLGRSWTWRASTPRRPWTRMAAPSIPRRGRFRPRRSQPLCQATSSWASSASVRRSRCSRLAE
jgi:hypothetical protein